MRERERERERDRVVYDSDVLLNWLRIVLYPACFVLNPIISFFLLNHLHPLEKQRRPLGVIAFQCAVFGPMKDSTLRN
jgi:hypothetical protein